jgi:hypothetical protein
MKTNESTYRMVDCVYLLCVFDVFLFAASGKEKVKKLQGKSRKKEFSQSCSFAFVDRNR